MRDGRGLLQCGLGAVTHVVCLVHERPQRMSHRGIHVQVASCYGAGRLVCRRRCLFQQKHFVDTQPPKCAWRGT